MTPRAQCSPWLGALVSVTVACGVSGRAPHHARPPAAVVEPVPLPAASTRRGDHGDDDAPPKISQLADDVTGVHRLGHALFVTLLVGDEAKPAIRVVRVGDDGALTDVAADMPPSIRATTRRGDDTVSGTPTALLGEPDGPIWMAFTHYSVFGSAVIYRAREGRWSCVGGCTKRPDPEPWATITEMRVPSGERVPMGDLVAEQSRGHLFAIRNRVSNEGQQYVLPRATATAPTATVRAIRAIDGDLVELGDGSIVDVAKTVPEATRARSVDGQSENDFWVLDESNLIHVRSTHRRTRNGRAGRRRRCARALRDRRPIPTAPRDARVGANTTRPSRRRCRTNDGLRAPCTVVLMSAA